MVNSPCKACYAALARGGTRAGTQSFVNLKTNANKHLDAVGTRWHAYFPKITHAYGRACAHTRTREKADSCKRTERVPPRARTNQASIASADVGGPVGRSTHVRVPQTGADHCAFTFPREPHGGRALRMGGAGGHLHHRRRAAGGAGERDRMGADQGRSNGAVSIAFGVAGSRHVGAGSTISLRAEQGYGPPAARRGGAAWQRGQGGQDRIGTPPASVAEDGGGNSREWSFCWLPVKEHG